MKSSAFEQRHAPLLRLCIYGIAFSAYFFDRVDVVWRFIRDSPSRQPLEHAAFFVATMLIAAGAWLCTRADAGSADPPRYARDGLLGDWLYAVGLSTMAPLLGCIVLVVGESLRNLRLARADRHDELRSLQARHWREALRRQATKWGVLVTMVVFTATLIDRVADYGIAASVAVWALLNWNSILRRDV